MKTKSLVSTFRKIWIFQLGFIRRLFLGDDKKRLFIDCGSNVGQGFSYFRKYFPVGKYDFILMEPNPHCVAKLKQQFGDLPNIEIIEKAVWTEDGTMKLFGLVEDHRGDVTTGASIVSEHNSAKYESNAEQATEVATIDFPSFLRTKFDYDEIVIKMDIEASEYDVLEKMIAGGELDRVEFMFVEFHSQYMEGEEHERFTARENAIVSHMDSLHKLYIWH
jgi:FkbM family methyltransferase